MRDDDDCDDYDDDNDDNDDDDVALTTLGQTQTLSIIGITISSSLLHN